MADRELALALRSVLGQYEISDALIDIVIKHEIKECDIDKHAVKYVAILNKNKDALGNVLDAALMKYGVTWNAVSSTYNFASMGLNKTGVSATEDLSAIRRFSSTENFDAAKALANMLRLIKAAERS